MSPDLNAPLPIFVPLLFNTYGFADYLPQKQKQQQDANADAAAGTKKKKVTAAQLRVQKGTFPSSARPVLFAPFPTNPLSQISQSSPSQVR
jgi:hypothetical protein